MLPFILLAGWLNHSVTHSHSHAGYKRARRGERVGFTRARANGACVLPPGVPLYSQHP